jgi:hypothetical protein
MVCVVLTTTPGAEKEVLKQSQRTGVVVEVGQIDSEKDGVKTAFGYRGRTAGDLEHVELL